MYIPSFHERKDILISKNEGSNYNSPLSGINLILWKAFSPPIL